MRIYLDAFSLQRPLDDRSQPRINIEAEAILTILHMVGAGALELLSSETLNFEIDQTPNPYRKLQAIKMLKLAREVIELNEAIEIEAATLIKAGIKPLDALHLASASCKEVDYFCTCDDRLLKKRKKLNKLSINVVSPLELVAEVAP